MSDQTLAALLRGGPDSAPALHVPDGLQLDFGGLAAAVGELAGILRAAGVTRGDRVVLVVPDGPVLLQTLLAVVTLGAAAAPLNPAYTHDEYVFFMEDLSPRLALLAPGEATAARAASSVGVGVGELVVEDGRPAGVQIGGRVVRTAQDFEPAQPDDIALLLHTSGTTSRPKQVPLLAPQPDGLGAGDRGALPASAPTTRRSARCRCSTSTASSPPRSPR